jgi:NADH dehydrogenase (ubiquinone) Fe-S protein 6
MYGSRLRIAAAARELPRHLSSSSFKTARAGAAFLSTTARQRQDYQQQQSPSYPTTTSGPASQTGVAEQPAPPPTEAVVQAPNRAEVWSRSQRPRQEAMTGPRFEQTDFELQVGFSSISRV